MVSGEDTEDVGLKIVVIPDTQVKPESDITHIIAAGRYIFEHKPDIVTIGGDWFDMCSLSKYNSAKELEGRRISKDLEAGYNAMDLFLCEFYNKGNYKPRLIFITGNHDPQVRIERLISEMPILEGFVKDLTKSWLENKGFEVYDFLDVVNINGVRFSHYFQNPHSAKKLPLSGSIDSMMKNAGFSFVCFHQQTFKYGKHVLGDGTTRIGIQAGAFYIDDEPFMGKQGNNHWRGMFMLNEVKNGNADMCEISINYLLRKYV